MLPSNEMCEVPNYGSSATYCDLPSPEQVAAGVVPLDSLPAAWWNAMWACTNGELNKARCELGQLIVELNNVLNNAGVCACTACTDQLYQSIDKIRQTLANATVAGAVKSSSQPSEVAVNAQGFMSVNCLGNAASLTTSASTIVGAINELKSTYDSSIGALQTAVSGKAPTSHVSSATTYGVGNANCYGHLKISDTYTSVLSACSGVAASQKALACVYAYAVCCAGTIIGLGNTAGCALGTAAAAGTATTAARSDHVHPKQTLVDCACKDSSGCTFGTAARYACTAFRSCTWTPSTVTNANKVCTIVATANSDRNLLIGEAAYTATCCAGVYVGNACKATFNPSTGLLRTDYIGPAREWTSDASCVCFSIGIPYPDGTGANCPWCQQVICMYRNREGNAHTTIDGSLYVCNHITARRNLCACCNIYVCGYVCGNVCGTASMANGVYATTHPGEWEIQWNWDGSYFQGNAYYQGGTLPLNVCHANSAISSSCSNKTLYQTSVPSGAYVLLEMNSGGCVLPNKSGVWNGSSWVSGKVYIPIW